jgi:putative ABC transport system ATP-binding protein
MLEIKNANKTFNRNTPDENKVFSDFSLKIATGEFVSVVGSNGSGKTTLLNLISGNLSLDGGEILLDGKNIAKQKEFKRALKIGRVFQNPAKGTAGTMTIAENMALAENKNKHYSLMPGLNKKRLEYYKQLLAPLDLNLENRLNTPVSSLSGGQRQALTLLIATMTPIDLLLLDEHTAALDPRIGEQIMQLTNKIVRDKGITTLMVTHNLRFAVDYGDRLLMLNRGQIVLDKGGAEKRELSVNDVLGIFNDISVECGN